MSLSMAHLNYGYDASSRKMLDEIKATAKRCLKDVGFTLEASSIAVTFFKDGRSIRFHLASPQHLTVTVPDSLLECAYKVTRQLVGAKLLRPIAEKGPAQTRDKSFRPAREVLAAHLADPEFAEHILVLPEALEGAKTCEFEHDGTLDRYLKGLVAFAKLKADPENLAKTDTHLAAVAGLGHFGFDLGERAKRDFAEDYSAAYNGETRLFPLHVTLGRGLNPRTCMSIYFDWDSVAKKLILARFGRHGRGA